MAVSLDSANRSFLAMTLVALLLSTYVICAGLGGAPLPLAASQASRDGVAGALNSGHSVLPVLAFLILVTVSITLGMRSIRRQVRASRRLDRRVRELTLTSHGALAQAASDVALNGRVVLLDAPERFSFAYGALTPRVAVSRGLLEGVS